LLSVMCQKIISFIHIIAIITITIFIDVIHRNRRTVCRRRCTSADSTSCAGMQTWLVFVSVFLSFYFSLFISRSCLLITMGYYMACNMHIYCDCISLDSLQIVM